MGCSYLFIHISVGDIARLDRNVITWLDKMVYCMVLSYHTYPEKDIEWEKKIFDTTADFSFVLGITSRSTRHGCHLLISDYAAKKWTGRNLLFISAWHNCSRKLEDGWEIYCMLTDGQPSKTRVKALAHYNWNCKKSSYRPYTLQLFSQLQRFFQQFYIWTTIFTTIFSEKSLWKSL